MVVTGGLSAANAGETTLPKILSSGLAPEQVEQKPYRQYVRECIELLIEYGTDRYGNVQSPVFVSILDVRTRTCPEDPLPLDEAWHVVDKATGECNRHGDGKPGCDFAMSGGEVLCGFALLYQKTNDPVWLERAQLVADYYWRACDPTTQLVPNRPNAGQERFDD